MHLERIPFPSQLPDGFEELTDEPLFNPAVHLQLEEAEQRWLLEDFGYSTAQIAACPSNVAAAGPFRVLSDEGAAVLVETSRRLEVDKQYSENLAPSVRFPAYRSRFIRDLATDLDVAHFVGGQLRATLIPHPLTGVALTHLNYSSEEIGVSIDRWHNDAVSVACVMAASDPSIWAGGRFEFFAGTTTEVADLNQAGSSIPGDRTMSADFPAPGWAMAVQGNRVVHRAAPLDKAAERTTFIVTYAASELSLPEVDSLRPYTAMGPSHVAYSEWARYKAWRARARIDQLLDELPFTDDRQVLIDALDEVRTELDAAIEDISDGTIGDFTRFDDH